MSKGFKFAQALLATSLLVGWAGSAQAQQAIRDQLINGDKPQLINNPTLLTLNLSNADVRAVLEMMGKKGGMNLIIDDSVTGQLSALSLKAVPLDEAFNLVLKMKNLSAKRLGTTLLIATDETFRKKGFAGTQTAMLRFDNAKIDDVENIVRQALSEDPGTGGGDGKGGSSAGGGDKSLRIIKDTRTNSLLITAPEDVIDKAKALKALLDVPTPQVEIEVKMIEVSENGSQQLGVSYGFGGAKFGAGFNNQDPNATAGGTGNQAGNLSTGGLALSYSALGNFTANFNARLDALVSKGLATVTANPKVVAQDNQAASINIVNQHPVLQTTTTQTGTTQSVSYISVGQQLTITPRIDTAGYVTLKLQPTISTEGGAISINGNSVPIVNSRSVDTSMRVHDNESIVIGGLKRSDVTSSVNKFPVLGDLPILGSLFRYSTSSKSTTEIIIEVTPHIQTRLQSSATVPTLTGGDNGGGQPPGGAPAPSDGAPKY